MFNKITKKEQFISELQLPQYFQYDILPEEQ